jgi:hypothetical protein
MNRAGTSSGLTKEAKMYPKYAPHQTDEAPLIAPGPPGTLVLGNALRLRNNRLNVFLAVRHPPPS